jgi:hypothetical protein
MIIFSVRFICGFAPQNYIQRTRLLSVYKLTWPAWQCPRPNPHDKPFGTSGRHKRPRKQLWISELCILSAMHPRVRVHTCQITYPPARDSSGQYTRGPREPGDNLFCGSNLESLVVWHSVSQISNEQRGSMFDLTSLLLSEEARYISSRCCELLPLFHNACRVKRFAS